MAKTAVIYSLLSTVVRAIRRCCCWSPWAYSQAQLEAPLVLGVQDGPHFHRRAELGWLEELGWTGFSLHVAFHLRLLTVWWSGRESDGVSCELRSPKGLEGSSEFAQG